MKKTIILSAAMLAVCHFAWAQDAPQPQQKTSVQAVKQVFITVLQPNGGEKVLRGAQQAIQWRATGDIGKPTIQIRKDGVVIHTFSRVTAIGPLSGNRWRWTWNVPATAAEADHYKVRVVSEDGRVEDESNNPFSVVNSKIEVYMPRAGARFRRGSTMTIHFRCFNVTQNLRVYQAGYTQHAIAANVPPDRGTVEWRNVGFSADGTVRFARGNHIIVATMDGTVYGYSHPYELTE